MKDAGFFDDMAASIRWNDAGLIPVIVQDSENLQVLMLAWMNKEALELTLSGDRAVYFSRSRKALWRKGDSSGNVQTVISVRVDCDNDCLLLSVVQSGAACHTGERSCFYRLIKEKGEQGHE